MTVNDKVKEEMTDLIKGQIRRITNDINHNRFAINDLAFKNAVLKRERTALCCFLGKVGNKTKRKDSDKAA
jgi:hypothetical protein